MLYSLLTFFGLHYFFNNYWISSIGGIFVFIIENTKILKSKCGCDTEKPQIDK
jgi:hypothetical protein